MTSKLNLLLFVIIASLTLPDLYKLGSQIFQPPYQPNSDLVNVNKTKPEPSPLIINPAKRYTSEESHLSFTLPEGSFQIKSDKTTDWGSEFGTQYAYTKSIWIEDLKTDRQYYFSLASIENDKPFAWEGTPLWYVPSLKESDSTDQFMHQLNLYLQSPIYIKNIFIDNLQTFARVVYTKNCYGSCSVYRKYLIPFEKTIAGVMYHTLAFSTMVGELGFDDETINSNLDTLKQQIPSDHYLDPDVQAAIKIQDQIVRSLTFQ